MPLHEYQCKKCKHKFEKIQKFSDRPVKKCPECGGPLEQVLHAPNVQFKGTGWYVTDYGGKKEKTSPDGAGEKKEPASGAKDTKETDKASKDKESKPRKTEAKKAKE